MAAKKKKAVRKPAPAKKKKAAKKKRGKKAASRKANTNKANARQANTHGVSAPTSREVLEANERATQIVRLRQDDGATMREIAAALDVSVSTVHYWLHQAAQIYKSEYMEAWEELRATTTQQLDKLISGNFRGACAGDKDCGSIVLRAMDQRSRLHGLYPDKNSSQGDDSNPFDGISEHERARLLVGLLDRAGAGALDLLVTAIERKRSAEGREPIRGEAVRKKNTR